jgi:hypothetical protein
MQSTFLTKEKFNVQKTNSEISSRQLKKLKILLNKTKESEIFEEQFYYWENIEDPDLREIKSWEFLHSHAKKCIEEGKKEFRTEVKNQPNLTLEFAT